MNELDLLFSRVFDGTATEAELRALHEQLRTNPEVRAAYIRAVDLHAALATTDVLGAGNIVAFPIAAPAAPGWTRRRWLAAAAAIFGATGIAWWQYGRRGLEFARVAQNAGAVLRRGEKLLALGAELPAGRLTLAQGSLGLNYGRGVELVIEGPAEFECRHADLFRLHSGRMAAHVPPAAVGFTVETARGRVVDRGTRFALDASTEEPAEVHVFEGKVDALGRHEAGAGRTLITGQAARFSQGTTAERELRDAAFVQPEELPAVVAGLKAGQQARWAQWCREIQADPALILFSQLDPARLAEGGLTNRLKVLGARPVQGRWPGKTCLEFVREGDALKVDVGSERAWPELTLMAWVRLDRLGEPYQSLYHTDGWGRHEERGDATLQLGQVHWMVVGNATMRFAVFGNAQPGEPKLMWGDSQRPVLPERGRWAHLAVVYEAEAHRMRFYLNGQFDSEVRQEIAHPAVLGPAQLGNWNLRDRKLSGRVDEFAILGRAFSAEEMQAVYAAGNPYA